LTQVSRSIASREAKAKLKTTCLVDSGVVGGDASAPQNSFDLSSLGKTPENLDKFPEDLRNSLKIRAKSLQIQTKMAPNLCRKSKKYLFFGGHTKKRLRDVCGRKFVGKSCTKTFRESLRKFL